MASLYTGLSEEGTHPPVHAAQPASAALPAAHSSALLRLQSLVLITGARLGLREPPEGVNAFKTVKPHLCIISVLACPNRHTLPDLSVDAKA